MKIMKEYAAGGGCPVGGEDLAQINALARRELAAEEVYTFTVKLCDNEVDREWERFTEETLAGLAGLFVGKSGIFDHNWSAAGQAARVYRTQVVEEPGRLTRAGTVYRYLKGWAYMLRTEGNRDLIAAIDGGITKEVSVGCAVEKQLCSVCGEEIGQCRHVKGRTYNGKLCWAELSGAVDAYEWSFVAVPAQAGAGVMKGLGLGLKALCAKEPRAQRELEELEKAAGLGRRYLEQLRGEVARLVSLSQPELEVDMVKSIAGKLEEEELDALKAVFGRQVARTRAGGVQLTYMGEGKEERAVDGAFLV